MKAKVLIMFLVLFTNCFYAQSFRASDLDGKWKRSDGMIIRIEGTSRFEEGSDAQVIDVGNSGWPQSARMVAFKYRSLKYKEGNKWEGINYIHMPQSNYRKEDGKVTISMSDDKQFINANGTTYTRE